MPCAIGQSLVEFALVLPILLLMLAGVLDLGRYYHSFILVTNAAREGARYGSMNPNDSTGINASIQNAVSGSDVTICPTCVGISYPQGNSPGNPIRVTVRVSVGTLAGSILGFSNLTLQNYAEMAIAW